MSESGATLTTNSASDKMAVLAKEAESLKAKLEEERHKLNDISCKQKNNNNFQCKFLVVKMKVLSVRKC